MDLGVAWGVRASQSVACDCKAMGMIGGAVGWELSRKEVAEGGPTPWMAEHFPNLTVPRTHYKVICTLAFARQRCLREINKNR